MDGFTIIRRCQKQCLCFESILSLHSIFVNNQIVLSKILSAENLSLHCAANRCPRPLPLAPRDKRSGRERTLCRESTNMRTYQHTNAFPDTHAKPFITLSRCGMEATKPLNEPRRYHRVANTAARLYRRWHPRGPGRRLGNRWSCYDYRPSQKRHRRGCAWADNRLV